MTTFEKAKHIRNAILSRAAEAMNYKWDDKFKIANLNNVHENIENWQKRYGSFKINPTELTLNEMEDLGFGKWSKDSNIMLIPFWLYQFLTDEFEIFDISNKIYNNISEIDTDHRMGLLAYGVIPKLDK